MLKAQNELNPASIKFTRNASLRDVVETIIEGKVVQHAFTIAEGLTSEQIVQRLSTTRRSPATSATCRARARCCRRPTGSPAAPRASR